MDQEKVNAAIRRCLQDCYGGKDLIPVIAVFIAGLKAAEGWDNEGIRAFEIGVHAVLHGIVQESAYAGDATIKPKTRRLRALVVQRPG